MIIMTLWFYSRPQLKSLKHYSPPLNSHSFFYTRTLLSWGRRVSNCNCPTSHLTHRPFAVPVIKPHLPSQYFRSGDPITPVYRSRQLHQLPDRRIYWSPTMWSFSDSLQSLLSSLAFTPQSIPVAGDSDPSKNPRNPEGIKPYVANYLTYRYCTLQTNNCSAILPLQVLCMSRYQTLPGWLLFTLRSPWRVR